MKNFLEWYLNIPPAQPGQGTDWTWLHQTPWPEGMPQWLVLILVVTAVAYVWWVYRRDASSASVGWRVLLATLRLSAIAVVLLILTELTLVVDRTGLPFLAVLIDDSASMSLEDTYSDVVESRAAKQFLKSELTRGRSRLAVAQGLLTQRDGEFLKRLHATHQVRVYRFSDVASSIGGLESESGKSVPELLKSIASLKADGTDTRPAEAIRKVLSDFRGSLPSAVVVLTDAITSTGDVDRLSVGAQLAASKLVPLYTVGVGTEEAMHDLNLYDVLVDDTAFVDDPLTITAKLKSFGFKGKSVTVTLREKENRTPLVTKQVNAADDGQTLPVELVWTPSKSGDYDLVLEVTPHPTEVDKNNNSESRQVSVREGRIRVLLVDSLPRWEYRELKFMLEREKTVELHTVLQDADLEFADQDVSAQTLRGRFPVNKDQLNNYDVVILGDVDAKQLGPTVLENLRDFVREAGGGLVLIAGPQHNPASYRGTLLQTLLPVELDGLTLPPAEITIENSFQPTLTLEGQKSTPIFRFDDNELDSLSVWKRLPGFYWLAETPQLKPGATVFVEHPTKRGKDRGLPVISMQRFGAGKVLYHATDETWLWRRRVGDLYFGRYWVQAIRYLTRSRLLGQAKQAELKADRLVYQRGETVNLRVRFFNESDAPEATDGVKLNVEKRGGSIQEVVLARVPQAPTVFEGQLRRAADGLYHAWITSPDFPQTPPSVDFRVESPEREMRVRGLDRKELSSAAKISRGRSYSLSTVETLPDEVPAGRPVPIRSEEPIRIWNRGEILALFVLLLTTEWLLRKRLRLV